jgi:hypothetical protein
MECAPNALEHGGVDSWFPITNLPGNGVRQAKNFSRRFAYFCNSDIINAVHSSEVRAV